MSNSITIRGRQIGNEYPCFIIAEVGVNHNGSLDLAKRLIDAAVNADVDAVKFQTFKTEDLILDGIEKAAYQKRTTKADESQTEMLKQLEIDKDFHIDLMEYCVQRNIIFLSTPYGQESLDLLVELGVPAFKIASTDTTNLLFLEKVAKKGKPVILSTGMSSQIEVERAVKCLKDNGCKELALLKCTSNYPTGFSEVNLRAMGTLKEKFDAAIGFSDHTQGLGASPYAVALGAEIVEKHFTLDKNLPGPDHQSSLSPDELVLWVKEIRKVEQILGSREISLTKSEKETKKALQKHLVSSVDLRKGDTISRENIVAKRTGGKGIPASESYEALGLKLKRNLFATRPICWSDLEK